MKDVNKGLRTAIYNALNGTVVYNAVVVPVFDGKVTAGIKRFIRFVDQQTTMQEQNDTTFISRATIVMEVVDKEFDEVSKDVLDDIGELVMEVLAPTPSTTNIIVPAGFQYQNQEISTRTIDIAVDSTDSIIRKLITYSITVTQM